MTTANDALFNLPQPTRSAPAQTAPVAPTSGLPNYLAAHIATSTGIDPHGTHTRTARPRPCPRCNAWTLMGLDNDIVARPATVTPTPLTDQGAGIAILTGLTIWHLHNFHGRLELETTAAYRTHRDRLDLVAEHACHIDLSSYATTSRLRVSTARRLPPGTPPPF